MGVVAMRTARFLAVTVAAALALTGAGMSAAPAAATTRSCSSSTPVASRPELRLGDTGSCVTVAQRRLVATGYSVGAAGANGGFGKATYRAVVAFQRDRSLEPDGVVGAGTWSRLASAASYNRGRGPNRTSCVVLSFDDCPPSAAAFRAVVDAAKAADIGLVLAPTGDCLHRYADRGVDLVGIARSHGQYVLNHSVSHPDLTDLAYSTVLKQLSAPGVVTNVGRPPYGATNATVASAYTAKGMRQWTWTVDTRDWTGKSASQVVAYVVAHSSAGSTVLMHMGWHAFTPSALRRMESGLANRGLKPCAAYHGTTPTRLPTSLPCTA